MMSDEEYFAALKKVLDLCEEQGYYIVLSDLFDHCALYQRDPLADAIVKLAKECK
jgi:hypothetical protein